MPVTAFFLKCAWLINVVVGVGGRGADGGVSDGECMMKANLFCTQSPQSSYSLAVYKEQISTQVVLNLSLQKYIIFIVKLILLKNMHWLT